MAGKGVTTRAGAGGEGHFGLILYRLFNRHTVKVSYRTNKMVHFLKSPHLQQKILKPHQAWCQMLLSSTFCGHPWI